jgi:hypothetical protein
MIVDVNLLPGEAYSAVNRQHFQAAIDSIPPSQAHRPSYVRIVNDGDFALDQPVFMAEDVGLDTPMPPGATRLRLAAGLSGSPLYAGIRQFPLSPDHYTDAFGRLDRTAAPTPGVRWALSSRGTDHLLWWASPWQRGPAGGWPSTAELTFELAFEGSLPQGFCFGISCRGIARPLLVWSGEGSFVVAYGVDTGLEGLELSREVRFAPLRGLPPGKHLLAGAVNLADPQPVRLWLDGPALAPRPNADPPLKAGARLARPRDTPFKIGAANDSGAGWKSDHFPGTPAPPDWTLYGLRLSSVARYKPEPTLARRDGQSLTDYTTLFAEEPGVVAYLPLQDGPDSASTRKVTCRAPAYGVNHLGLWVSTRHAEANSMLLPPIRNLALACRGDVPFGAALTVCGVLDLRLMDCELAGGRKCSRIAELGPLLRDPGEGRQHDGGCARLQPRGHVRAPVRLVRPGRTIGGRGTRRPDPALQLLLPRGHARHRNHVRAVGRGPVRRGGL